MVVKVGIIGPTNMKKLSKLTGKSEEFLLAKARQVGELLAARQCELWVNSDGGMVSQVAQGYKQTGGSNLVILYPERGEPWPNAHAKAHTLHADKVSYQPNWFFANYRVVTEPDVCICVGLSAGTLSELAYVKWNCQFEQGNLQQLIPIQELIRGGKLPPEIEVDIQQVLLYSERVEDLPTILSALESNAGIPSILKKG